MVEELCADCAAFVLELLELDACCAALFALRELAFCAALLEVEVVVALEDFDEFDAEVTFDEELSPEADWSALLEVLAEVPELPLVELLDAPPLAAVRVSLPLPVVVDVAPPPEPELLCVELPDEPALEGF